MTPSPVAAEDATSSTNGQAWRQVIDRLLFVSHPHVRAGGRSPAIYYEASLKVSNYSRNSRWTYLSLSVDQGYRDSMAVNYVHDGFCTGFGIERTQPGVPSPAISRRVRAFTINTSIIKSKKTKQSFKVIIYTISLFVFMNDYLFSVLWQTKHSGK